VHPQARSHRPDAITHQTPCLKNPWSPDASPPRPRSVQPSFCGGYAPPKLLLRLESPTRSPNPKGPPSSPVQLRSAVWTGVTRDTGHTFTVDGSATTWSAILGYNRRIERVDAMPEHDPFRKSGLEFAAMRNAKLTVFADRNNGWNESPWSAFRPQKADRQSTRTNSGQDTAMTIVVIGATGNTGRAVVKELRALGQNPVCVVRNADKAREVLGADAKTAVAELTDRLALEKAVAGVQSVFVVTGHNLSMVE